MVENTKLIIDGVSFEYDAKPVLADIEVNIAKGEFVGLVGPNGSGKTTLLRTITNLLQPSKGVVILDGKDVSKYSKKELAREIAVVSQDTQVAFDFTVEDIVLMGRTPYLGRFQNETRSDLDIAREAMVATDTLDFSERLITSLSGGEMQRVIVARALAQHPSLLLLDEPTSHLDIKHQVSILDLLKRLNSTQSLTVIASLHDLNLAAQYCDYLVMLSKGKIFCVGTPDNVLTEDNVRAVYDANVIVTKNPVTGCPSITPLSKNYIERDEGLIHIIPGGGCGSSIMRLLTMKGYRVSSGVVNIGDSDWEEANSLGIEVVEEKPFSPITPEKAEENLKLIESADMIVVSEMPFGNGNILNLEMACKAMEKGIPVILIETEPKKERDYTNGRAADIYRKLKQMGAKPVRSMGEVMDKISELC